MIKAIKSVYCYYFPEVRQVAESVIKNFDHNLLLTSIFPGLDNYHQNLVSKFIDKSAGYQKGLKDYQYKYFCNGSTEAIFHLLVNSNKTNLPIYVLRGDYEGYREYAKNIGIEIVETDMDLVKIARLPKGRWIISNPSAIDGNFLPENFINQLCEMGHELIVDVAYLGFTPKKAIDLTHKNIIAVIAAMSKPYGMFYYRVGFCFSRIALPTLYPNIWFKNILSIQIAEKVLDKFGFGYFYKKYLPLQRQAIKRLNKEIGVKAQKSDVLLLANLKTEKDDLENFRRVDGYRFCLTPYFLEFEQKITPES